MSGPRVKICGTTNEPDLETVVDAGADAVGIVCDVPVDTSREVAVERATELAATVPPFVTAVLVTMPDDIAHAIDLVETVGPDAVQIHGGFEPGNLETVRSRTDTDVLVAVDAAAPTTARRYDGVVDALVIDSADDDGAGGTGETHDWERTRAVADGLESPVVLAGGLTPDNVANAVETVDPFAVDVASGVEASGGVKDESAVESFVERATTARSAMESSP
ncbi:phosphoribosylanthranilate isomerase [Natronobacterium gregoryi]|uniref:N-(5'-phosphoribosyl)anthranilate isomerase n=2 Tax=Natronobacterium gregoryi TaxID=44930 RepID=L0ALU2_NATGS|nr:phosphoribosylanthranilate isomerase [Natronobacterium gregoryi]AFZ74863.1 phosphoribosylanthranilate isomerase [Natronobacterium gregoryi SP2]ELY73281.1 phosphoribosylanthranilate isomerase [Natronobacterium gregoryi SP2]PLK19317.1 phosphoribosylanthranilate isomerase [Natronobacterium gregoryi SP2]SFJ53764.1 phosphoribosylanthranilate isomerase [Natronobacterium gregoryi]